MTPDFPTDETPAAHIVANVPQQLHLRLGEEAHLRMALRAASEALQERTAVVRRLDKSGSPLGGLIRKFSKKQESPELRAAREEEKKAARAVRRMEEISRKIGLELDALVDVYLADTVPEFPGYRDARKKLQPWEQAVTQFQAKVGKLVDLLGQARNMANSGYDKKKRTVSNPTRILIEKSVEAARAVAKNAETANEAARTLGQMPEIRFDFKGSDLSALEKMEIAAMQAEFDRIIKQCEDILKNEVEAARTSGVGEAETKRQQALAYVADYLAQIRRYADEKQVVPDEVGTVLQRLEARYLNR